MRAHVVVSGRVQGVFFRSRTKQEADLRNVKGWVRNLNNGRVEAVFEGEESSVRAMVEFCKGGPIGAKVSKADVVWMVYVGEFQEFDIRY